MCHKQNTCPNFERRTINGVEGTCNNCEYIKSIERTAQVCKTTLAFAILIFIFTTFFMYG